MQNKTLIAVVCLLLGAVLSVGCASPATFVSQETAGVEATEVEPSVGETETATVEVPTEEPSPTDPPTPTATEVVTADACTECHLDKDRLVALAKPEQEVESESSGVG